MYVPVLGAIRSPVYRAENVSGPMLGAGEPFAQLKFRFGSSRLRLGPLKSWVSKYSAFSPLPMALDCRML